MAPAGCDMPLILCLPAGERRNAGAMDAVCRSNDNAVAMVVEAPHCGRTENLDSVPCGSFQQVSSRRYRDKPKASNGSGALASEPLSARSESVDAAAAELGRIEAEMLEECLRLVGEEIAADLMMRPAVRSMIIALAPWRASSSAKAVPASPPPAEIASMALSLVLR